MKELYLIRHTTPRIESGICYGNTDLDLDDNFIEEAAKIKKVLVKFNPEFVFSSPLIRCRKLAKYLFPHSTIQYDDRLKELHFGDWEMQFWKDINQNTLKVWGDDFVNHPAPNGESFTQLLDRTQHFMTDEISQLKDNSTIAMITHSGILRCLISQYLHIPLDKIFRLKLNFGAVVKISLHKDFEEVDFIK